MSRSRVINLENLQQFTAINVLSDPGHIGGPVVIPNAIQVVLNWTTISGKGAHNVLYGSVSGGFTPTQTIANAIFTGLTTGGLWTTLAALMTGPAGLSSVSLRDVRNANQPIITSSIAGVAGTGAGPELPNEVALCVTFRTALTGPANRGRMYVPNWDRTAMGAGNVASAAAVTALGNWAANIPTVLSGQGMTLSIGHPARQAYTGVSGTQHPARAANTVPVTSTVVRDNHWDSQRRRGLR